MYRIGFLGSGKIARAMMKHVLERDDLEISFVQTRRAVEDVYLDCPVITQADEACYKNTDLIVEAATPEALKENFSKIITYCDILPFSLTAFSDEDFEEESSRLCEKFRHVIYIPHGAIMGLDGILDGRRQWTDVEIESTKNPKSIGRSDTERTVVFEGTTREITRLFPRNVNVHAAVAIAGIGFDRTISRMIADPSVNTNRHKIILKAPEMNCVLDISSVADGGITGAYVPYSACGSLDRVLRDKNIGKEFV